MNQKEWLGNILRKLMTKFAGFWYGAWILPLYPIDKEIKFWFTRKEN